MPSLNMRSVSSNEVNSCLDYAKQIGVGVFIGSGASRRPLTPADKLAPNKALIDRCKANNQAVYFNTDTQAFHPGPYAGSNSQVKSKAVPETFTVDNVSEQLSSWSRTNNGITSGSSAIHYIDVNTLRSIGGGKFTFNVKHPVTGKVDTFVVTVEKTGK